MDPNVIVGIIAIFVTVLLAVYGARTAQNIFKKQKPWRRITFEAKSINIINNESSFSDQIKILFRETEIHKLDLLNIVVSNDGNLSVKNSDINEVLKLGFDDPQIQILSAEITEKHPEHINITAVVDNNTIRIETALFNQEEWIRMRVFVNKLSSEEALRAYGRIDSGEFCKRNEIPTKRKKWIPFIKVTPIQIASLLFNIFPILGLGLD